jgi:hypothetical protein
MTKGTRRKWPWDSGSIAFRFCENTECRGPAAWMTLPAERIAEVWLPGKCRSYVRHCYVEWQREMSLSLPGSSQWSESEAILCPDLFVNTSRYWQAEAIVQARDCVLWHNLLPCPPPVIIVLALVCSHMRMFGEFCSLEESFIYWDPELVQPDSRQLSVWCWDEYCCS